MNAVTLVCFFALAAVALARPGGDRYTDKYDNVDIEEVLGNKRLLIPYVLCALNKGKCAPDAKELKENIIDALETECSKCTDPQKKGTRRVIQHLINKEPEYWSELTALYDPHSKYSKKYEKELKEIQQ